MGKGNFTHTGRVTQQLKDYSNMYNLEIKSYKALAEGRRGIRKYTQEGLHERMGLMLAYIDECKKTNKPMTISGLNLASGMNSYSFNEARNGEYDFLLDEYIELNKLTDDDVEYIDNMPYHNGTLLVTYSEILDWMLLMVQEQREMACSSLRGNPAGNIFLLKAQNGFKEESSPQTVNQTLVIADADKAKEAMKLLGD